jgi:Domain of unknown function (DUF3883)
MRSSTLNAITALRRASSGLPERDLEELADHLRRGPAIQARFDYATALNMIRALGLRLSDIPEERVECYHFMIYRIILESRPHWLRYVRAGVSSVEMHAPPNVRQCLKDAGLFETSLSKAVREWWDRVRSIAYDELQRARIKNGTTAELLCINREREILASIGRRDLEPRAVSVSDDSAGFDVLTFRIVDGNVVEHQIEVKGFTGGTPTFHLSPNEWMAAQTYGESYRLQLWSLDREQLILELTSRELARHIACNRGWGEWNDLIVKWIKAADEPP